METPLASARVETIDLPDSRAAGRVLDPVATRIEWVLRLGAAACFIGHGAFGILTKEAWLPYFAVAGIPPEVAYRLMPVIGTVDILAGLSVLVAPTPAALLYMVVWATWTALLRPLAGEPFFETLERAGNYGVPLALLVMLHPPRSWAGFLRPLRLPAGTLPEIVPTVLRWTTGLLLFGHGALAAVVAKPMFAQHYAAAGLPGSVAGVIGWLEIAAAVLVVVWPRPIFLMCIALWKIATEALFPISGSPIWEFVERGGSYAAPLALALWRAAPHGGRPTLPRSRT